MINIETTYKPVVVPVSYMPIYRVIVLLGILKFCTFNDKMKANIKSIHLYLWAFSNKENYIALESIKNKTSNCIPPWSMDKDINKILSIALGNSWCECKYEKSDFIVSLTLKGDFFLRELLKNKEMTDCLNIISNIGYIPENRLSKLIIDWTYDYNK